MFFMSFRTPHSARGLLRRGVRNLVFFAEGRIRLWRKNYGISRPDCVRPRNDKTYSELRNDMEIR